MKLFAKLRSYTRSLAHRSTVESDIEAELRSHIDLRAADLERTGLAPAEPHRRACIEFGTVETHKQNIRTSLGLRLFDEFRADLRFAARMLRRNPGSPPRSASSRSSSRPSGSTASWPTPSPAAPARSASAWRSARGRDKSA